MLMAKPPQIVRYRCLERDCGHEFDAGPGPVHSLGGGACPACGGLYVGRLTWYIVMCNPRAEAAVADKLRAMGHSVVFLYYLLAVKRSNRTSVKLRHTEQTNGVKIKRPVLPGGYVFVGVTPEPNFKAIEDTPGVAALLRREASPAQISQSEIDRLRSWGDADGLVPLSDTSAAQRQRLTVGSLVRITRGPFEGFERPVERDDGRMIRVLADLFGGWVPVDLAFEDVEVVREAA